MNNSIHISEIGIIGMGRFGKLLANILSEDFKVYGYDVSNKTTNATNSLEFVASREVVIYCVPILKFEVSLRESVKYIKDNAYILDVLSVKTYAYDLMKEILPKSVSILPTHPMFGPDAIKNGREGLPFVLCKEERTDISFFNYLENKKFSVITTSSDEHDKVTANSLCLTQLIGRVLIPHDLVESEYDTRHYKNLFQIKETASNDTFELFVGLQKLNPYAKVMREKLKTNLSNLLKELE